MVKLAIEVFEKNKNLKHSLYKTKNYKQTIKTKCRVQFGNFKSKQLHAQTYKFNVSRPSLPPNFSTLTTKAPKYFTINKDGRLRHFQIISEILTVLKKLHSPTNLLITIP